MGQKNLDERTKSRECFTRVLETNLDGSRFDRDTGRQAIHPPGRLRRNRRYTNRSRPGLTEVMDKTVTTLDLTGERAVRNGRLEGAKQTPPLENEDRPGQLAT